MLFWEELGRTDSGEDRDKLIIADDSSLFECFVASETVPDVMRERS